MLHSLRFRLLLTLIGVVIVVVGTVALFASRVTSRELQRYVDLDMERNRRLTDTLMTYYGQSRDDSDPQRLVQQLAQETDEHVIVTDGEGRVQADSQGQLVGQTLSCDQSPPAVIVTIGGTFCAPVFSEQTSAMSAPGVRFAKPIAGAERASDILFLGMAFSDTLREGSIPISATWKFESAIPALTTARYSPSILIRRTQGQELDPIEAGFISTVNRSLIWSVVAAGIAAMLLTLALSRRILGPVEALTAAARAMERGDLSQRVRARSNDEIGQLAHAFNAMADGLARQERLRRTMVGDVAHELRTPLTNIRGYLEALRDGVARPEPALLASLHDEALLLNRLVDDLQDLTLAEAGQLHMDPRPVALREIVDHAAGALRPALEEKQLDLQIDLLPDLPHVQVDPERVGQVLRNLLNNAIVHTPAGGRILVSATDGFEDQETRRQGEVNHPALLVSPSPCLLVSVRDSGSGIPREHLPNIFERFYRADRSRARATGGAGLGLAIVKQLVQAHGGRVWAESAPGLGTCISFTLPAAPAELHHPLTSN